MSVTVSQVGSRWIAQCSYEQREIAKAAGFRWDREGRCWYTTDAEVAAKLASGDLQARLAEELTAKEKARKESISASRAHDANAVIPVPEGLEYLPYQRAGIAFALKHNSVLIGDEMGLGKTIQAIGIINADESLRSVLVISPASLKLNWKREMEKWLTRPYKIVIGSGSAPSYGWRDLFRLLEASRPGDPVEVLIVNYDILTKWDKILKAQEFDLAVMDEAHYLKNPDAKRTQAVVGREKKGEVPTPGILARRRVALTGTPIPNRPIEGWSIFHYLDPAEFKSFWGYAKRYADAHNNGYGWDFTGAANLGELQDKLRASIMVRRKKADVLTELPAKRRQLVELSANGASGAIANEVAAWERQAEEIEALRAKVELAKAESGAEYEDAVERLRQRTKAAFEELSKLRHETALAKVPYVIEHLESVIDDENRKVVVFAHHRDVVQKILEALKAKEVEAVSITGDTAMVDRQAAVDRFQSNPACRVFVGNIQAAGVGLTLTAAAHVVFAELDWVPGNITQAEDRCHRIGQREMVLVQHLVLDGSLDAKMAKTLIAKQAVIDQALDAERAEIATAPVLPLRDQEHGATESVTRTKIEQEAEGMTAERKAAVHEGLRMLAGMDEDHARELNNMGFSKIDVRIGHDLAMRGSLTDKQAALGARLVNKYRRQLPAALVETAKG